MFLYHVENRSDFHWTSRHGEQVSHVCFSVANGITYSFKARRKVRRCFLLFHFDWLAQMVRWWIDLALGRRASPLRTVHSSHQRFDYIQPTRQLHITR